MIGDKVQDAINQQINEEMFSSYLYWAMAAYFEEQNLDGFAHWMELQAQEETAHAVKFYKHLVERGGRAELKAIAAPQKEWASPLAAFKAALEHERHITACINGLVDLALAEKDHATNQMLQWFVAEQVEEEASADFFVQKLAMAQDAPGGLLMLDRAAAARGGD